MNPLVSVIIPTYNSERTIENCLKSIVNQTYKNIEIIVVDNNSTDNTKKIAKNYTDRVYNSGPERTYQKNKGIEESKGLYIFFVDSDMNLSVDIVYKCVTKFKTNNNIGGICIPERSVGEGFFVKVRDYERSFYKGTSIDSARFYLLNDVKQVGGFEEDLIFFEESLLPQKIEVQLDKKTNYYIDSYIHHDEGDIKLLNWLKKKFYYGKSLKKYKLKVKQLGIEETSSGQTGISGRYKIFLNNNRFYNKPLLALSVLGLKTLEFLCGAMGLIFSKK